MMTSETPAETPASSRVTPVLRRAAGLASVSGAAVVALGAATGGSDAAYGALVGTALLVGVLALGAFAVDLVSSLLPSAALLVAMLTYTLQVVLLGTAFAALSRSGLLDDTLDRGWLAAGLIVGTFVWLTVQVVLTTRLRIPAFEPVTAPRLGHPEGGER